MRDKEGLTRLQLAIGILFSIVALTNYDTLRV